MSLKSLLTLLKFFNHFNPTRIRTPFFLGSWLKNFLTISLFRPPRKIFVLSFAMVKIFFDDVQFVNDINAIASALPTPDDLDDSTRALAELQSFVAGHERFFIHEADKPDFDNEFSQGTFECYGKIFKNGEVAFLPTALKKILETELGFASMDALISEWDIKEKLRRGKGKNNGRRISTWFNGKNNPTYRFKAGVILSNESVDVQNDFSEI